MERQLKGDVEARTKDIKRLQGRNKELEVMNSKVNKEIKNMKDQFITKKLAKNSVFQLVQSITNIVQSNDADAIRLSS